MSGAKASYVSEPTDQSQGRPATFIFLHGYQDDAQGLPLGLAQQFQFNNKLPYLRWLLPNASFHSEARIPAWYMPKALPNPSKPRIPGRDEEDEGEPDDEEGILKSVGIVDELVQAEIDRGVDPKRIVVGGFSQGCAISLVWGLIGKTRAQAEGVVCLSGYLPLADRIEDLRTGGDALKEEHDKKWFYVHGSKDMLVSGRLYEQGKKQLKQWIREEDIEEHMYEGMGHSTCNAELRDMLAWFGKVVPP